MRSLALLVAVLFPVSALARCVSPCQCFGGSWVAEGTFQRPVGQRLGTFRVERVLAGEARGLSVGEVIEVAVDREGRWIVDSSFSGLPVSEDGSVTCGGARARPEPYAAALIAGSCDALFGTPTETCRDNVRGCSTSSTLGGWLVGLLAWWTRARARGTGALRP
ncbi:MAG: hypothetical protein MUC96_26245 [Myxococcaceae bacterium]|jgi:hypothetical protein|nr:hypothetical protein [Myxococcaceae bacterium]